MRRNEFSGRGSCGLWQWVMNFHDNYHGFWQNCFYVCWTPSIYQPWLVMPEIPSLSHRLIIAYIRDTHRQLEIHTFLVVHKLFNFFKHLFWIWHVILAVKSSMWENGDNKCAYKLIFHFAKCLISIIAKHFNCSSLVTIVTLFFLHLMSFHVTPDKHNPKSLVNFAYFQD